MAHKTWLDNEYKLWVEALAESTVHNFKENETVKRMLGEVDGYLFFNGDRDNKVNVALSDNHGILNIIDKIGCSYSGDAFSGTCLRMVYYALKILELNPKNICEIGAGVGQFYAVLRALGYEGDYYIYDLPEVQKFQREYLSEVSKQTGLKLILTTTGEYDLCISFYALGEFDNETKNWYITNVVNHCPHGFIIWNAHSGASTEINIKHKLLIQPEQPLTLPGNLQVSW